jgi:hypothetical protein
MSYEFDGLEEILDQGSYRKPQNAFDLRKIIASIIL